MTQEHIDRFERMQRPGSLIEPLTEQEAEEDYRQMVELQEQMMDYAYRHVNYPVFMDLCYIYLCNWYLSERAEMITVDMESYRSKSHIHMHIFTHIENHVMSCIIDQLEPCDKRVEQIARQAYTKSKRPF